MFGDMFFLILAMLSAIGLVHILGALKTWLCGDCTLSGAMLVVPITEADPSPEARLSLAYNVMMQCVPMSDVQLTIICECPRESENYIICSKFCNDHGLTMSER